MLQSEILLVGVLQNGSQETTTYRTDMFFLRRNRVLLTKPLRKCYRFESSPKKTIWKDRNFASKFWCFQFVLLVANTSERCCPGTNRTGDLSCHSKKYWGGGLATPLKFATNILMFFRSKNSILWVFKLFGELKPSLQSTSDLFQHILSLLNALKSLLNSRKFRFYKRLYPTPSHQFASWVIPKNIIDKGGISGVNAKFYFKREVKNKYFQTELFWGRGGLWSSNTQLWNLWPIP